MGIAGPRWGASGDWGSFCHWQNLPTQRVAYTLAPVRLTIAHPVPAIWQAHTQMRSV